MVEEHRRTLTGQRLLEIEYLPRPGPISVSRRDLHRGPGIGLEYVDCFADRHPEDGVPELGQLVVPGCGRQIGDARAEDGDRIEVSETVFLHSFSTPRSASRRGSTNTAPSIICLPLAKEDHVLVVEGAQASRRRQDSGLEGVRDLPVSEDEFECVGRRCDVVAVGPSGAGILKIERLHRTKRGGVATFVVQNGRITGTVIVGPDVYLINPLGNGLHAIVKTNPSVYPAEHPPGTTPKANDAPEIPPQKEGLLQNQSIPVIRAMVLYTPAVRKALAQFGSDPDVLATMAIESTNLASKNSNVRMSVNLVKSEEIAYVEKDFPSDLAMLRTSAWVKTERDAAKAHVVFLLTTVSDYCGLSDVILADKNSAFSVINYICAVGNFSLAHEFGHLLGLRHERAADKDERPFRNGHGYVYKNEWRTIMATRKACASCPQSLSGQIRQSTIMAFLLAPRTMRMKPTS